MRLGDALFDMLKSQPAIAELVADRIYPVDFLSGDPLPALIYNTRGIKKIECRDETMNIRTGIVEIGILSVSPLDLEAIADTVLEELDGYTGIHAGFGLSLTAYDGEFDQKDFDIDAYYKPLQFEFSASKL